MDVMGRPGGGGRRWRRGGGIKNIIFLLIYFVKNYLEHLERRI